MNMSEKSLISKLFRGNNSLKTELDVILIAQPKLLDKQAPRKTKYANQIKQTLQLDKDLSRPRMTRLQLRNKHLCNQVREN